MGIVERLLYTYHRQKTEEDAGTVKDAADEIERLREDKNIYAETIYELEKDVRVKNDQIERLREALQEIIYYDVAWHSEEVGTVDGPCATLARSALQQNGSE